MVFALAHVLSLFVQAQVPLVTTSAWDDWYRQLLNSRVQYCLEQPRTGTVYFSPSGSDSAGDGTLERPFASLAKAQQVLLASGGFITLAFERGGVWREGVGLDTGLTPAVAITDYGDSALHKPVFTPFRPIGNDSGTTDEAGVRIIQIEDTVTWVRDPAPLIRGNSYAFVAAHAGSWYYDSTSGVLYAHSTVDGAPLEYTQPTDAGLILRGDGSYARNIVCVGWGMKTTTPSQQHGIEIRCTLTDQCLALGCESYFGSSHVMTHLGTSNGWGSRPARGGIATFVDCKAGWATYNGGASESIFNTFSLEGGQDVIFDHCEVVAGTLPSSDWSYQTTSRGNGFYGHTGGGTNRFAQVVLNKCLVNGTEAPSAFSDLPAALSLAGVRGFVVGETFTGATTAFATDNMVRARGVYTLYPGPSAYAAANWAQSGWCIDNNITLDLSWQQWDYALFNALPNTPITPRFWFNTFTISAALPTTTFRLDYDSPTQAGGGSFINNAVVNISVARTVFVMGGVDNNAYFNCTGTSLDQHAVLLNSVPDTSCDGELNCRAASICEIDTDVNGPCGERNTIGAVEVHTCADFNHDLVLDFFDYLDFVQAFSSGDQSADFNRDQTLDFFDYLDFVDRFVGGCV